MIKTGGSHEVDGWRNILKETMVRIGAGDGGKKKGRQFIDKDEIVWR